jgi:hypothetical protein
VALPIGHLLLLGTMKHANSYVINKKKLIILLQSSTGEGNYDNKILMDESAAPVFVARLKNNPGVNHTFDLYKTDRSDPTHVGAPNLGWFFPFSTIRFFSDFVAQNLHFVGMHLFRIFHVCGIQ